MDLIPGVQMTASALDAEKTRIEVTAQNITNAFTTRDADGQPYQRKEVAFEAFLDKAQGANAAHSLMQSVRVSGIVSDKEPGERIYKPHHPHADDEGMVLMPNVKMSEEMVNLITASHAYTANLTAFQTSKELVNKTLSIGKA
ncbi:MAG TPA: flagellar basal body rod protein FlgC [Opitutae bacterium]|nr:flagellar basal body rod protein FlgC [Opitutae bacterium]|tara:strand:+ start:183 stop:611 length:429 start_codon:yes stop_codon:yes gene_type:complete